MSKLLFDRPPISIDPELATAVGLSEAVFIQQLHYWVQVKRESPSRYQDSFHDGFFWVYNSVPEWIQQMPFIGSDAKVRRFIKNLKLMGIIITSKFNKAAFDKTTWYRIDYVALEKVVQDRSSQNDKTMLSKRPDDLVKMTRPIPETSSEITSETTYKQKPCVPKKDLPPSSAELFWKAYKRKKGKGNKKTFTLRWNKLSAETQEAAADHYKKMIAKFPDWANGESGVPWPENYVSKEYWLHEVDFDAEDLNPTQRRQEQIRKENNSFLYDMAFPDGEVTAESHQSNRDPFAGIEFPTTLKTNFEEMN